ncbi:MAG TPA: NAD(P)-binding protein, partial [Solirubrobacterales bacterium]|nr:NAD(P)-binding protein [Solirubrobacterales bacterium]
MGSRPDPSEKDLGLDRPITRRDFLDGVAIGAGALTLGGFLQACDLGGRDGETSAPGPRPEEGTGLHGLTDASFEIPHRLRDGTFWATAPRPEDTGERYDLIIVGAGISGLAAARYWQHLEGEDRKILILDPLEQPGGHAAQNNFTANGDGGGARTLIGYGGSQTIDSPSAYSAPAAALIEDIGIDLAAFRRYFDRGFNKRFGLGQATFFDEETYGRDHLGVGVEPKILRDAPLAGETKLELLGLLRQPPDPYAELGDAEAKAELAKLTYLEFLERHAELGAESLGYLQNITDDEWGYGIDALGAIDAWADAYPGMDGMGLDRSRPDPANSPSEWKLWDASDPYIHHFPQGNAGVARSIIRRLIPSAVPGEGMESIALAELDYGELDSEATAVRIRMRSPAVRVRNDGDEVEVVYADGNELRAVRGGQAVLACWNAMIPYLSDEISERQREALGFATKLSLVYANVQIRNWESLERLGIHFVRSPNMYWSSIATDFPVSMGGYEFPGSPSEPMILHLVRAMVKPGLSPREQGRAGRAELMATTFEEIELKTRDQLNRILGSGG